MPAFSMNIYKEGKLFFFLLSVFFGRFLGGRLFLRLFFSLFFYSLAALALQGRAKNITE